MRRYFLRARNKHGVGLNCVSRYCVEIDKAYCSKIGLSKENWQGGVENLNNAAVNPIQFFLIGLAGWIHRHPQNVIEYLLEESRVLKEQLGKRPRFHDDPRQGLAAKAQRIWLTRLKEIATMATPRTLLDWHRRLVARKDEGRRKRSPGRPSTPQELRELILRMVKENRTWGYPRIQGALQNLGHEIGRGTLAKVWKEAGVDPAPEREHTTTWKEFLRAQGEVLAAADFFCVEVWTLVGLVRYQVCLVIRLARREVHLAGMIPEPQGSRMKPRARNPIDGLEGFLSGARQSAATLGSSAPVSLSQIQLKRGGRIFIDCGGSGTLAGGAPADPSFSDSIKGIGTAGGGRSFRVLSCVSWFLNRMPAVKPLPIGTKRGLCLRRHHAGLTRVIE